jgi:GMP synthase-like glutamine amidotransferase
MFRHFSIPFPMNIHWLQHVEFEGLGCIAPWLIENGHDVTCTRLWAGDELPPPAMVDGLIVMGGPMGVSDEAIYPWLAAEKTFIKAVIDQNKPVLGICLGAQLIANVLGSNVWKNDHKEIGFFPILGTPEHEISKPWKTLRVFHWHGDTFGIPDGAVRLASSEATANQAFLYKDKVLALQFHLETTEESLLSLYENARDEITTAPFIQPLDKMRPFFPSLGTANALMFDVLNRLFPRELF